MNPTFDIYGEIIPDRINTDDVSVQIQYPEQLIITFESVQQPSIATVTTTIRTHILESKRQGVQADIVLNFCIGEFDGINSERSDLYIQKFITLAEYIQDIRNIDSTIKIAISVRGLFLKSMIPLLYIKAPVKFSKAVYVEPYYGDNIKYYTGCLESFLRTTGTNFTTPLKITENDLINQKLITK
jgi:hypothetical protein